MASVVAPSYSERFRFFNSLGGYASGCEEPLTSEMAERSCAYYISTVTREYLKRDYDDDDVGSDRRSEILSQNEQFAPFSVEDETGSVPVSAEEAEVDADQVVN